MKINIVFVSVDDGQIISVFIIVTVTEISLEIRPSLIRRNAWHYRRQGGSAASVLMATAQVNTRGELIPTESNPLKRLPKMTQLRSTRGHTTCQIWRISTHEELPVQMCKIQHFVCLYVYMFIYLFIYTGTGNVIYQTPMKRYKCYDCLLKEVECRFHCSVLKTVSITQS